MSILLDASAASAAAPRVPTDALPSPRGPLSEGVIEYLTGRSRRLRPAHLRAGVDAHPDDGDVQLALWVLDVAQVAALEGVDRERVGALSVHTLHWELEQAFESQLRRLAPTDVSDGLSAHLGSILARPSVVADEPATIRERFVAKAPYLAWEADPHTMALARVDAPLKAPLVEIQAGEYGLGHGDTHAQLYRRCLGALGVTVPEAVGTAPAAALAFANAAWLFGRHHHLRGAAVGQLCLLELDSVEPCRRAARAWDAAGLPEAARRWYDVHALADVEHAEIVRDRLVPTLETDTPWLVGAAAWGAEVTWALQARAAAACDAG